MALVQTDEITPVSLTLDLAKAGWPDGAAVRATVRNEEIDYRTGKRMVRWRATRSLRVAKHAVTLDQLAPGAIAEGLVTLHSPLPLLQGMTVVELDAHSAHAGSGRSDSTGTFR